MATKRNEVYEAIGEEIVQAGIEGREALTLAADLAMGATTAEEAVHIIRSIFCLLTRGRTLEELTDEDD